MSARPLRLFVAVDPAPAVRDRLRDAISRVRPLARTAKWVDADALHLTLSFLGDTAPDRAPEISAALAEAARDHAPFEIGCGGAGAFGGKRPRVLWTGVTGAVDALAALQRAVVAALAPLGFTPEARPFAAHLTLARAREAHGDPGFSACAAALAEEDFGATRIEDVILYRSDLSPKGPTYTPLARLALSGVAPPG